MIFGHLFKPKWQHKESSVRIEAIETLLNSENNEDIVTLKSLIENDECDLVRRAALIKLNRFEDWFNASQSNSNKKTKSFAEKKVEDIVFGRDKFELTVKQKFALLDNSVKHGFIESWLKVESDPNLIITLYEKLDKSQLKLKVFAEKSLPAVQNYLIELTDDVATLEKMTKKACDENVKASAKQRIEALIEAENKPKLVAKQTQLVLSKLLALRDEPDYEVVLAKRASIETEWAQLHGEFGCLSNSEEFEQKYTDICQQLVKVFSQKAEAYEQAKIAKQLAKEQQAKLESYTHLLDAYQHKITDAIFENVALNIEDEKKTLEKLSIEVDGSSLAEQDKRLLVKQAKQFIHKLDNLSDIAASVTQATHLIAKAGQLSYPNSIDDFNEKWQQFDEWQQQWNTVIKVAKGYLPQAVIDAHKQISNEWQAKTSPYYKEQQKLFHVVKKKFADLNRLISNGKYNAVFGVFKHISRQFPNMSIKHQKLLQKELEKYTEKVNDLSDWEHYVATPKKEKLLSEIQQLSETPLDSPVSQSEKVKEYRKLWNSLGHAEEAVESSLNDAFNQACEKAFEPCRLYFAEQEKLRVQNLNVKKSIIEEARSLAASIDEVNDGKALDASLSQLRQKWRQSGDIDRNKYAECKKQFDEAILPIKEYVKHFHETNANAKKRLIAEAENALEIEDVFQATNNVKALQKEWSTIGYSGVKEENDLWKKFRKVNDLVFAKRTEAKQQADAQLDVQLNNWLSTFDELEAAHSDLNKSSTQNHITSLEALYSEVKQVKHGTKSLLNRIEKSIAEKRTQLSTLNAAEDKAQWLNLFTLLNELSKDTVSVSEHTSFQELPQNWQKKLSQVEKQSENVEIDDELCNELLVKIEILAGVESPSHLKQTKMKVQIEVMQEQMTSTNSVDLTQLLFEWLSLGKLGGITVEELDRLKSIYVAS